ncbi:Proline-rich receptor-like protein kinase PERK9 [Vitis vinifera]|uniref:non-specific serine/threonine protein kinase n=1 Tax=Vitis vinifera TaxID=29760 RepID=A0A438KME5_VITVI|nr:Proline-rich receptor-like protein kinase PERK9 [Vitis vinifera]
MGTHSLLSRSDDKKEAKRKIEILAVVKCPSRLLLLPFCLRYLKFEVQETDYETYVEPMLGHNQHGFCQHTHSKWYELLKCHYTLEDFQSRRPPDRGLPLLVQCSGLLKETQSFYLMLKPYGAIVGGAAGVLALVAVVVGFVWFCKLQYKNFSNKNSETGSSDPSAPVEWNRRGGPSSAAAPPLSGPQGARQFTMEELEQATKQFNESNLIGYGSFGLVYKGFLSDGTIVAIKRRPGPPRREFVAEATNLSEIQHRNLVTLLGYCQETRHVTVVHCLTDTGLDATTKLEFKRRLSIALGAAKGLRHLHTLKPPLVHRNFKTANVLVDENFIAKVADTGISRLLEKIEDAGPSQTPSVNVFQHPEIEESRTFSEISDVYSFGVFLLELITGREALYDDSFGSDESLFQWVETRLSINDFVDHRLVGSFTMEGMKDLIKLMLQCMSLSGKWQLKIEKVVLELERIHEKEMALTTGMGEGTTKFTLGSQLFTSK